MKPLYPLILSFITLSASAQKSKLLYYDADWKPAKYKTAVYYIEQVKISDTCYEWNYYAAGRPRLLSVCYKDVNGKTLHGRYINYRKDGYPDSTGNFVNGKRHGEWDVLASNNQLLKRLQYINDQIVSEKDSATVSKELDERLDEEFGKSNPGDGDGNPFLRVETESEFQGAGKAWQNYLLKNLRYPQGAIDRNAMGMVIIQFIVDKDGKISFSEIYKSTDYFLDKEALRMIVESPDWAPALQDGRPVKSYKRQPIIFRLE
ncbi:MAG TPA: energy transducer TonB [Chitinophagaceae bacterium]